MLKKALPALLLWSILFAACKDKKNKGPVETDEDPLVIVAPDSIVKCQYIPPPPEPFGWNDTTVDKSQNITAFMFNPANANEVICICEGDIGGYNELFTYNIVSKQRLHLANVGEFLPSVNRRGLITFSSVDNDIYLIKSTGDSLQKLTGNKSCQDPKWDYTGKEIIYFQQAYLTTNPCLVKTNFSKVPTNFVMPASVPYHAAFRKSDRILYHKTTNTTATVVYRDLSTQSEQNLISAPYNPKSGEFPFSNLTLDNADENFYWSNSKGVYKCSLITFKTDTILKNCPNFTYEHPWMSFKDNELTLGMHVLKQLGSDRLFHQYKTIEMNLLNRTQSEIKIFP